jgi:hypothetical protein
VYDEGELRGDAGIPPGFGDGAVYAGRHFSAWRWLGSSRRRLNWMSTGGEAHVAPAGFLARMVFHGTTVGRAAVAPTGVGWLVADSFH